MDTCLSSKVNELINIHPFIFKHFLSAKRVGTLASGTNSGESVLIPSEFRWPLLSNRINY